MIIFYLNLHAFNLKQGMETVQYTNMNHLMSNSVPLALLLNHFIACVILQYWWEKQPHPG
jgi:hypothetical protein